MAHPLIYAPEGGSMATASHQIEWQHDLDQALDGANGKPVLVDFSAAPM